MNVFHDGFQILVPGTVTQSDRVNVHAFCSPDLPFSGALGPAEKFENQQEFLPTRHTSPTRQITTEEGEGLSHVGNFGSFRPEIIHEKGNRSICTAIFRGACRNRKSLVLYHILRGAPLAPE